MQKFRNFVRGPVGIAILVLFLVPFVITGFYGYFEGRGADADTVAEVNGRPIKTMLLAQRVEQMRAQMRQQVPDVDAALVDRFVQPAMVLQGLVNNELVLAEAQDMNMLVSGEQAAEIIVNTPQFQENGKYSPQMFEQFTRARGMTPAGFMRAIRGDMLMMQIRSGFTDTEFAVPGELAEQRRLAEQKRDIRYVVQPASDVAKQVPVTEEEIRQRYDENTDAFMRPEQYRIAWVELSADQVEDQVEVTEEDIEREYEARRTALAAVAGESERREAAHIQISTSDRSMEEARARAAEVRKRLAAGESFAAVARDMSDDAATASDGGVLGEVTRGDLPEPMAEALFALEEGEVSEPVEVDGNLHIVKLKGIERREIPSLDEMRDRIAADLRESHVQSRLNELALRLEELAYEHPDLQQPAAAVDAEVRVSDWMTLEDPQGIAAEPEVLAALKAPEVMEDKLNSELVELGDDRYVVARIRDEKPAEPIPFAEVRDTIERELRMQRAAETLSARGEKLEQKLAEGATFAELAKGLGKVESATIGRDAAQPARALVLAAFRLPRPASGKETVEVVTLPDGSLGLIQLLDVRDGNIERLSPAERDMALAELASVEGERALNQAISHLRSGAEIDVNETQLSRFEPQEQFQP